MVRSGTSPELDSLGIELIAMCAIGKGLASLDPEARLRVLRWANERFQPASVVPVEAPATAHEPAPAPVPALRLAPEPDLAVDALDDLFEEPVKAPPPEIAADSCGVPGDAEDLSDLYELASEPAKPQLHLVTREELPFDQLVDDFVDSFRRLRRESQRLTS
jgi:hypothetical protein